MDAKTYSIRLHAPEAEKVEELTDEQGYTKSEAVRRLVEDGIDHRSNRAVELTGSLGWASLALSLAGLALGFTTPAGAAALIAAVLFVASAVARYRGGL